MSRRVAALLAVLLAAGGCTGSRLAPPQPTFSGLQAVRAAEVPPLAVGRFAAAPGLAPGRDRSILIRAAALRPPQGTSFADYLAETLRAELTSAGRLDPASPLSLSGLLTENRVDSGLGRGRGVLAAAFILSRGGREIWRKTLQVERDWDSNFIGAVAYLRADQNYGALYQMLVAALFADPDFRRAVRPAG